MYFYCSALKYRPAKVSHNAFSLKMIGPMDWFNGMEGLPVERIKALFSFMCYKKVSGRNLHLVFLL